MHEMSLAAGVLKLVEDSAAAEGFKRVARLKLAVGKLSGVEVESLRFALTAIAPGTVLAGAAVEIEEPPGEAWCMTCGQLTTIKDRGDACGHCGGYRLQPSGGTELRVVDLLVDDE